MSLKRGPTTELNHENWEKEDVPEEKGNFSQAAPEELQQRVIKKARRKLVGSDQPESNKPSVFTTFKGFGSGSVSSANASTVSSTSSPFSFLTKLSSTASTISLPTTPPSPATEQSEIVESKLTAEKNDKIKDFQFNQSTTYYSKLKGLNIAVTNWIKQHVDQNPLCILTPIFQDYERYLKEIKESTKNGSHEKPPEATIKTTENKANPIFPSNNSFKLPTSTVATTSNTNTNISSPIFTFTKSDKKPKEEVPTTSALPAAKISTTSSSVTTSTNIFSSSSVPTFSFGQSSNTKMGFNFSSSNKPPILFGGSALSQQQPTTSSNTTEEKDGNDDDDEPPKVEFKPIVEDDSVYSKRCKVFVKNADNYKDLGVGTLHLKPVAENNKTQLLVRADTSIGKIILNLILSEGIPTQRMGKNNVMMICIPTPDAEQNPVTVLLRVKTGEEADELLETINKYKK